MSRRVFTDQTMQACLEVILPPAEYFGGAKINWNVSFFPMSVFNLFAPTFVNYIYWTFTSSEPF